MTLIEDPAVRSAYTRDADDDYLIALAREQGATWIVTGDDDLLAWGEQLPPALSPAAFEILLKRT